MPHKDLRHPPGFGRSFATNLKLQLITAPDYGDVAKMLNLSTRKLELNQLSAFRMKISGTSNDIPLVFPFILAAAHHDRLRRNQGLKRVDITRKPCPPHAFPDPQQFRIILFPRRRIG
jgi:hypothetical protein